jgi:hypothetical protein
MRHEPASPAPSSLVGALCVLLASGCVDVRDPILACEHASIQDALNRAPDGGRVLVCDGIHDEALTIRRPVTLLGESRDGTVITGGGGPAIATVHDVAGLVSLETLTLRPPEGTGATTTGLAIVDSPRVTLAQLDVDFAGVVSPRPSPPPDFTGLIGIDVATSNVELRQIAIRDVGASDVFSVGLRVRGLATVRASELALDGFGGPGVLVSGAQVELERSTIRRGNTDGVEVLSGELQLLDTTIEMVNADGLSASGGYLFAGRVQVRAAQRYGLQASGGVIELVETLIEDSGEGIHSTFGLVAASECVIRNSRELGLYGSDAGVISFARGRVEGGETGVLLDYADAYVTLSDTTIRQTGGRGVHVEDGQFLMSGGRIEDAGREGVFAEGGGVLLDAVDVSGGGADGVVVTGTTNASLAAITSRDNAGWGVLCDGGGVGMASRAHLEVCTGYFDDNALGRFHLFNNCQILYTCLPL